MSVIHFKVVALLVASMPPRHTWPLSLYVAQGHSASCLVPRQPHSPPPTAEILLPIGKWGEVGAWASQLSIIPVLSPQLLQSGSYSFSFCTPEASDPSSLDPSTLLPHLGAETEKPSPPHSCSGQGSPELITQPLE